MLLIERRNSLDTSFVEQFRAIYHDSFPPSERLEFEVLIRTIALRERSFFGAWLDDELVGFAILLPLTGMDVVLLEYIAVNKKHRGRGIGSQILKRIVHALKEEDIQGMILEVESDEYGDDAEQKLRSRRIEFYKRNGAEVIECARAYCAPDLSRKGVVTPMKLMWLPIKDKATPPRGVLLKNCIRAIFMQSYGRPVDDPLLRKILHQLVC